MVPQDFPQAPAYALTDLPGRPDGPFAVLTEDRQDENRLLALAEQFGPRLLIPEVWSQVLPQTGVLVSSALSGGTMAQRLAEAAESYPHRCWLLLEPMAMEFPLPCPTGNGVQMTTIDCDKQFYSEALCCQYAHFVRNQQGFVVLWDTEKTLQQKKELAKEAGFLGYVCSP